MSQEIQIIIVALASPIATWLVKTIGLKNKTLIPYVCAALAGIAAGSAELAGWKDVIPVWLATVSGVAGVGVREIFDQTKKALLNTTTTDKDNTNG